MSRLTIVSSAAAAELAVMALCLWFATFATQPAMMFRPVQTALLAVLCSGVVVACNMVLGQYRPQRMASLYATLLLAGVNATALSLLALLVLLGDGAGSVWLVSAPLSFLVALMGLRLGLRAFVLWAMAFGALERRAIVAGGGRPTERMIRALADRPENDIRIVAIFDDRDDARSPPHVLGVPNIGGFDDVMRFVDRAEIDLVLITLPLEAEARIKWILSKFKALPQSIHLVEFAKDYAFDSDRNLDFVLAQKGSFELGRRWQKRVFDLVFGTAALLFAAPIMFFAALLIRLDSRGPIFFTQWRHGFSGRAIPVLKFRSMYHNQQDSTGTDVVKRGGDPRVTRIGALLRKTSIDELPQLFGVLRGDLSLVGPRPHALDARSTQAEPFANLIEDYASRHRLPPGITGWAQVNGFRGGIDHAEELRQRVAHDLHYIENWSLWFDLRVLLRTPFALLNTRNAF